jgi:hypothetical protein
MDDPLPPGIHRSSVSSEQIRRLQALIVQNSERIQDSHRLISELRECLKNSKLSAQERRDALNPKIIRLLKGEQEQKKSNKRSGNH